MEVTAKLRNVPMGARKARAVADLIRRRSCADALSILQASPKAAARPLEKLLRSALANAEERNARQEAGLDVDNLYVQDDHRSTRAPTTGASAPAPMGRASWIRKQTSHFQVVLAER